MPTAGGPPMGAEGYSPPPTGRVVGTRDGPHRGEVTATMPSARVGGTVSVLSNRPLVRLVAAHLLAVVAEYGAVVAVLVYAFEAGGARTTGFASVAILTPDARRRTDRGGADERAPAAGGPPARPGRAGGRLRRRRGRRGGRAPGGARGGGDGGRPRRGQHAPAHRCGAAAQRRARRAASSRPATCGSRTASASARSPGRWSRPPCSRSAGPKGRSAPVRRWRWCRWSLSTIGPAGPAPGPHRRRATTEARCWPARSTCCAAVRGPPASSAWPSPGTSSSARSTSCSWCWPSASSTSGPPARAC